MLLDVSIELSVGNGRVCSSLRPALRTRFWTALGLVVCCTQSVEGSCREMGRNVRFEWAISLRARRLYLQCIHSFAVPHLLTLNGREENDFFDVLKRTLYRPTIKSRRNRSWSGRGVLEGINRATDKSFSSRCALELVSRRDILLLE